MDHARAEELDPSVAAHAAAHAVAEEAGHADLGARLDEREVRRAEAHTPSLAEQRLRHRLEGALEIGERDALVDDERLDLVEHGQVGGVCGLPPVHAPRRDDVDGRRLRLHRADLDRARLGAQQELGMPGIETYSESFIVRAG